VKGVTVAKFALFFSYSSVSWHGMIESPSDRAAAARAAVERVDGTLESIYWMLGEWDGIVIFDAPSSVSAAAVSVSVRSTGAFERLETHELFEQDQLGKVLAQAKPAREAYTPPAEPMVFQSSYLPR
jgi:uncharacterized protein with GYD domain